MYYKYTDEELRSICRTHIESFEKWARIIIHKTLSEKIGLDYIHAKGVDGNYLIKTERVKAVDQRMAAEPHRFPTPVDALFLDDIIYLLCKPEFYQKYFRIFLNVMYPDGRDELKTFLDRLIPIRNKLSHANPLSIRDVEQCICYCNDFIACVKEYFRINGMEQEFNIPTIIKVTDSLGNEYVCKEGINGTIFIKIANPVDKSPKTLFLGDKISINLTVDPSFNDDSYSLIWDANSGIEIQDNGKKANIEIKHDLIGESVNIRCVLKTNNQWHRYYGYDQAIIISFKALP